jgi:hypothetical protein
LRVLKNKVLRTMFGSKRGEVTEDWRKVHMRNFVVGARN